MNTALLNLISMVLPYVIKFVSWLVSKFAGDEIDKNVNEAAKNAQLDQIAKCKARRLTKKGKAKCETNYWDS